MTPASLVWFVPALSVYSILITEINYNKFSKYFPCQMRNIFSRFGSNFTITVYIHVTSQFGMDLHKSRLYHSRHGLNFGFFFSI